MSGVTQGFSLELIPQSYNPHYARPMKSVLVSRAVDILDYDAEYDIGLIAGDVTKALQNTTRLNAALAAMWSGGSYSFRHGPAGPVLRPIRFPGKEYFFEGPIITSARLGGALIGYPSRPYLLGSDQYALSNGTGGCRTQFTRIDGENGGAVIRLRGQGFTLRGITFMGRKYTTESGITGPTEGTATPIGIEIEGRATPATGGHIIQSCMIASCTYGIACRHGYHDPLVNLTYAGIDGLDDLHFDENHGDSGTLDTVSFFNCNNCFYSENVQAIAWVMRSLRAGKLGSFDGFTVFNIVRGGDITVHGLELMGRQVTILSVGRDEADWPSYNDGGTWKYKYNDTACPDNNPDPHDYSPLSSSFTISDFKYDGFSGDPEEDYLTMFKYAGPNYADWSGMEATNYKVRMTGEIGHPPHGFDPVADYDTSRLIEINDTPNTYYIPRTNLLFDVQNLPQDDFTILGAGPWYYPTPPA